MHFQFLFFLQKVIDFRPSIAYNNYRLAAGGNNQRATPHFFGVSYAETISRLDYPRRVIFLFPRFFRKLSDKPLVAGLYPFISDILYIGYFYILNITV